jgi:hypothetical protein
MPETIETPGKPCYIRPEALCDKGEKGLYRIQWWEAEALLRKAETA